MVNHGLVGLLIGLAAWILLSGLDDLFIGFVSLFSRRNFSWPTPVELHHTPERRIAIFVPLWHEHRVIGQMLDCNLASIRYSNYDIFVGVYPNDTLTKRAVAETAARDPRVHMAVLPHPGPTSKGDCLNWIHRRMCDFETENWVRFDIIVTHDAEDLIHPESLGLINWFSRDYQMIQIPVLALPTGLSELTHGLYCDEFAEFQSKDIPVRQRLGGFLAGNGVGTGFDRDALDRLAATRHGRIFDPECLTEDYENGFVLHSLGARQIFVPLRFTGNAPVATREYFPRNFRAAVRQRSRWVAGISLQGWERHGWRVPARQRYWFWRDRKGLLGNLLSPAANILFIYGLATGRLPGAFPRWAEWLCALAAVTALFQIWVRSVTSARVYGYRFASLVPIRMLWGNVVNFVATASACSQFVSSYFRKQRLAWSKTDHDYPVHAARERRHERIGEVLVRIRAVPLLTLEEALRTKPPGRRLGDHLVQLQHLSEENLYHALSVQGGLPTGVPPSAEVDRLATRALPAAASLRWNVLPYRIVMGQLHLMTAEIPTEEMTRELSELSRLELRFRLVRPSELDRLTTKYLPSESLPEALPA